VHFHSEINIRQCKETSNSLVLLKPAAVDLRASVRLKFPIADCRLLFHFDSRFTIQELFIAVGGLQVPKEPEGG
jgi:hypothetical protein